MVSQDELSPALGSTKKRKRVGRGVGSGHGKYSGRGCKGQKARSGGHVSPHFEGGQTPLVKRLPKRRGFTNIFKVEYSVVNVGSLNVFGPGTVVTPRELYKTGLVKSVRKPIKVLGEGELRCPLVVRANRFSQTAKQKIEVVGGRAEEVYATTAS